MYAEYPNRDGRNHPDRAFNGTNFRNFYRVPSGENGFLEVSLGTRPRYSLVVDEDVKKPTKQTIRSEWIRLPLFTSNALIKHPINVLIAHPSQGCGRGWGRAIAQSLERATPGQQVLGSVPAGARSLPGGSMSVE